jgi:hypothetical protein
MVGELVTLVNVVRSDGKYLVENSFDKFIAGQRKYTSSSISDIKKIVVTRAAWHLAASRW